MTTERKTKWKEDAKKEEKKKKKEEDEKINSRIRQTHPVQLEAPERAEGSAATFCVQVMYDRLNTKCQSLWSTLILRDIACRTCTVSLSLFPCVSSSCKNRRSSADEFSCRDWSLREAFAWCLIWAPHSSSSSGRSLGPHRYVLHRRAHLVSSIEGLPAADSRRVISLMMIRWHRSLRKQSLYMTHARDDTKCPLIAYSMSLVCSFSHCTRDSLQTGEGQQCVHNASIANWQILSACTHGNYETRDTIWRMDLI